MKAFMLTMAAIVLTFAPAARAGNTLAEVTDRLATIADQACADPAVNQLDLIYEKDGSSPQAGADKGEAYAENDLGVAYVLGIGVAKDPVTGADWIAKSAAQDSDVGLHNLGELYHVGLGVPKDDAKAVELFLRAGAKSAPMTTLALMYCNGDGVAKDDATAAYLFAKGGEAGANFDAYEAGLMLGAGRGAPQNLELAWYFFSIADRSHHMPQALAVRDMIVPIMTPAQIKAGQERFAKWQRNRPY